MFISIKVEFMLFVNARLTCYQITTVMQTLESSWWKNLETVSLMSASALHGIGEMNL